MKIKILSIFLSCIMAFSTTSFVFADTEVDNSTTEPPKIEKEVKQVQSSDKIQKEETKEETKEEINKETNEEPTQKESTIESKEEATSEVKTEETTQELKKAKGIKENKLEKQSVEEQPTTEEKQEKTDEEIQYPIKISYSFQYIDGTGNYTQAVSWHNTVYKGNEEFHNGSKMKLCYNNYVSKYLKVKINGRMYEYAGYFTTTDKNTTIKQVNTKAGEYDTIHMYGKDYKEDTTVVFKAKYKPVDTFTFTADYSDALTANGGGGESHVDDGIVGYQHTFKTPPDIPKDKNGNNRYEFVYWEEPTNDSLVYWVAEDNSGEDVYKDNKGVYTSGEKIGVKPDTVHKTSNVTFYATYKPIVTINYHDENGEFLGSVTSKAVNIYASGEAFKEQKNFLGWYEEEELIASDTIKELPLTRIDVPTEFNVYAKYEPEPASGSIPAPTPGSDPEPNSDPTPGPTPSSTPSLTPSTTPDSTPDKLNPVQPHKSDSTPAKSNVTKTSNQENLIALNYNNPIEELNTRSPITIKRGLTPFGSPEQNYWALLNLLLVIATCILAFILLIFGIFNRQQEDEEVKIKNKWWARIASICVSIIALFIFLFTEDINNPWIWIDQWTLLMLIIFIVNIVLMFFAKHKEIEDENEEEIE